MPSSYLDRMVAVSDVGWSRYPDGRYWVTWTQDGEPQFEVFRSARAAGEYAAWLDTTGRQPTAREVKEAELALRDLDAAVNVRLAPEESRAYASLAELEPMVQRRPGVRVRRHSRGKP